MQVLQRRVLKSELAVVKKQLEAMAAHLKTGDRLGVGDAGPAVEALQRHLKAAGLYAGATTGRFDDATRQAVEAFQTAKKLPVTGDVGRTELQAIRAINVRVKDGFETAAKVGQRGTDVLRAERMLEKLGYKPGDVDGVFDLKTLAALERLRAADKQVPDRGDTLDARV
ncbi:MAG: peptidoglycan-binding domain-containing protein, partial [Myxococcales bacterium]